MLVTLKGQRVNYLIINIPLVFTGVHAGHWITTHGIALNCNIDLSWFEQFTPCGINCKGVTSLTRETNQVVQTKDAIEPFIESFEDVFDCTVVWDDEEDLKMNGS